MSDKWIWRCLAVMYLIIFGTQALHELRNEGYTFYFWYMAGAALFNSVLMWGLADKAAGRSE